MKKLIAMVLALTFALSLATVVSAADISGDIIGTVPGTSTIPNKLEFTAEPVTVDIAPGGNFDPWNGEEVLSVASSDPNKLSVSYKKTTEADGSIVYSVKLTPKKTITAEEHEVKVTIVVAQVKEGGDRVRGIIENNINMYNARHLDTDLIPLADDTYKLIATDPVIDASVFAKVAENEQKLSINYASYSVVFPKVSNQDTSLYLAATTSVPDYVSKIAAGKDVKYINFPGNPYLKDNAKISVNFNNDWQNENGTTAYVYAVKNDVLVGEPIIAAIENGAVVFETKGRLGEYAVFATKMASIPDAANDTSSTPSNPNTGDSSTIVIAMVLATLALAGAGFVAVKKASR